MDRSIRYCAILQLFVLIAAGSVFSQDQPARPSPTQRLHKLVPQNPDGLQRLLRYNGELLPVVSAHRGGARAGYPENCIATFEATLEHTFAMLEIDPRRTKDGAIVVHHDPTLDRTTTGTGKVVDWTLKELRALRLKDPEGAVTNYRMSTLDEVLQWARGKTILVLDQKDVPLDVRVKKVTEHRAESYAILIVYSFKDARKCYQMNKNIMMEVMIPNRKQFDVFAATGIPWSNIVAFVGHTRPADSELMRMIHQKGTCCIAGTSRNLDRQLKELQNTDREPIQREYRELLSGGVDLIETDLPIAVKQLLFDESTIPASKSQFFRR